MAHEQTTPQAERRLLELHQSGPHRLRSDPAQRMGAMAGDGPASEARRTAASCHDRSVDGANEGAGAVEAKHSAVTGQIVTIKTPGGFVLSPRTGMPQQFRVGADISGGVELTQVHGIDEVSSPIVISVAGWAAQ